MKKAMLVLGATFLFGSAAYAGPITYLVSLSGANENPPNASAGTGSGFIIADNVANTLTINFSFSGLTGTTTASHIHCCAVPPGNAMVATTTPTFAGFPTGVTSGTYSNVLDLTLASSYNPAFLSANGGNIAAAEATLLGNIALGNTYLNVHTSAFPGGEIRGFFAAVTPEPATWLLSGIALAGLGALRRLRSRS